jgi:putative peptidoglycan lipid II flippase
MALGYATLPWLVRLISPGFDAQRYYLSIQLSRMLLPFAFLSGVSILFSAMLNAYRQFGIPAAGAVVLNISIIFCLLGFSVNLGVVSLAVGFLAGTLLHILLQTFPLGKYIGGRLSLTFDFSSPDTRKFIHLFLPILSMLSIFYLNAIVVRFFASHLPPGGISALQYANRLMMVPVILIAGSAGIALLPSMSVLAHMKDREELVRYLRLTLRFMVFILTPVSVGIIILRHPIVSTLFEHGAFGLEDTRIVSTLLVYYLGVMTAFPLCTIFRQFLYASQYTKPLIRISLVFVAFQALCSLFLMPALGINGLALGASLAMILNASLLYREIAGRIGKVIDLFLIKSCLRTVSISLLAGLSTFLIYHLISSHRFSQAMLFNHCLYFLLPISAGLIVFVCLCEWFRVEEMGLMKKMLRNRFQR